MTKTTEPKKRLNASDIFHLWANRKIDEGAIIKAGAYWATKDRLYRNSLVLARWYEGVVLSRNFNYTGAFGNGMSTWDLCRAMPNDSKDKIYYLPEVPSDEQITDKAYILYLVKKHFLNTNSRKLDAFSSIKEYLYNNRFRSPVNNPYIADFTLNLPKFIWDKFKDDIYKIPIKHSVSYRRYHGWGYGKWKDCMSYDFDTTIGDLLNYKVSKFWTRKELSTYKFRVWRDKYSPANSTIEQAKKLYNNKYYRAARIEMVEQLEKEAEARAEQKKIQATKNHIKNIFKKEEDWRNGVIKQLPYIRYDYIIEDSKDYQRLRLLRDTIVTSLRVTITLKEGKLAYNMLKRYDDYTPKTDVKIAGWRLLGVKQVKLMIYKPDIDDVVVETHKCIIIGCHTIPEFEADNFVKRYNLDW